MGHLGAVGIKSEYLKLQQRLDKLPVGAPAHPALFAILEEVFSPRECRLAAAMPLIPAKIGKIAGRAGLDFSEAKRVIEGMVPKGLVVDLPREGKETLYFLNPTVIGFFEFSMMRVRDDIDQKKLARLFHDYIHEDPEKAFLRMMMDGATFIARPLVHPEAVSPELHTEILSHEKASTLVAEAGSLSEGICHCRHVKEHLGQRCANPITHCLSLGTGADYLVGAGLAKRIDPARALEILAYSRANDMVMMADNVREQPTFICNCCKCCCEMLWGFRTLREQPRLVTSNFVARVSAQECSGCGNCAKACPVEVIDLVPAEPTPKHRSRKQAAQVNEGLCLGCGVCHRQCKTKALRLHPTGERIHTPATLIEKLMVQALERGKIQHFIFDDPSKITHRALGAVLSALVNLPPSKKLLAQKQIKSRVMQLLLLGFGRTKAAKAVEA